MSNQLLNGHVEKWLIQSSDTRLCGGSSPSVSTTLKIRKESSNGDSTENPKGN